MAAAHGDLPFEEQIAFFRRKVNLPTVSWTQLYQEGHDQGFVVAGANREALVTDFRQAVDKAISQGTTIEDFRKDFDRIVATHGWDYNGGRNWRSRVIYDTNLRTSFAAGRYAQLQAVKGERPYWEFHHTPVAHPRELHVHWNGMILSADDPWWAYHYPPDGWGCQCIVYSRSEQDLARRGKSGPDTAPEIEWEEKTVGVNGPAPRTVRVPKGVDPGFAYTPGATAWGRFQAENAMAIGQTNPDEWERLVSTTWRDLDRPEQMPVSDGPAPITPASDAAGVTDALKQVIGSDVGYFRPGGAPVTVVADVVGQHLQPDRSAYLPLLIDTLRDPYEVWASLEKKDAYYEVKLRAIKVFRMTGRDRGMLVVAEGGRGFIQAWTMMPVRGASYLNKQRQGTLLYGK